MTCFVGGSSLFLNLPDLPFWVSVKKKPKDVTTFRGSSTLRGGRGFGVTPFMKMFDGDTQRVLRRIMMDCFNQDHGISQNSPKICGK